MNGKFLFNFNFTPFLISPKGEKILKTPSPLGEGWVGGY
jgi:hypothetical protein